MHNDPKEPTLNVTNSFNALLSRMAALDHAGILSSGRKILRNAKRQRVEPTMSMSEVIELTGMPKEDLEFFISCRLIAVTEPAGDPILSLRDIFCLVKIFSRVVDEGIHRTPRPKSFSQA